MTLDRLQFVSDGAYYVPSCSARSEGLHVSMVHVSFLCHHFHCLTACPIYRHLYAQVDCSPDSGMNSKQDNLDEQSNLHLTKMGQDISDRTMQELDSGAEHTYENVTVSRTEEDEPYYAVPSQDQASHSIPQSQPSK